MTERAVRPKDCALAFALPLTLGELSDDRAAAGPKNFAWELSPAAYEPVAELAQRVAGEAVALGVRVVPRAALADVRTLLREYHVVTVFAHACMVGVAPDDVRDPEAILERVRNGRDSLFVHLAGSLRGSRALVERARPGRPELQSLRRSVAAELDQIVAPAHAYYERTPMQLREDEACGRGARPPLISRAHLEEAFPGELHPAPSVEFSDRLHTIAEVVAAVPDGFAGVIDLVICNSLVIAEAIYRRHRKSRVLANEMLAPIAFRLGLYSFTVREIGRAAGALRYSDATLRVRKALLGDP